MKHHPLRSFALAMGIAALVAIVVCRTQSQEAGQPSSKEKQAWKSLFDGKSLSGWKSANFGGEGEVEVRDGAIVMDQGNDMTGVTYGRTDFPRTNYEVTLEGKRLKGNDFFCTTTFPVGDTYCSLVTGGWGGTVVGLSSINGLDASENETSQSIVFQSNRWYDVRIRVTPTRIEAWLDDKQIVDQDIKGKQIYTRIEVELSQPLGIASYRTKSALREIRLRRI